MTPPTGPQSPTLSPAEISAMETILRANAMVRGALGKVLRTPLAAASRDLWTELDSARALEENAIRRFLEAGRPT